MSNESGNFNNDYLDRWCRHEEPNDFENALNRYTHGDMTNDERALATFAACWVFNQVIEVVRNTAIAVPGRSDKTLDQIEDAIRAEQSRVGL